MLADIRLADGSSGLDAVNDLLGSFAVPVVFVTAYPERLMTGERPEPTFLITKPFREDAVKAIISQVLFFDQQARRRAETAQRLGELTDERGLQRTVAAAHGSRHDGLGRGIGTELVSSRHAEQAGQLGARAVDAALDGADGTVRDGGCLLVREAGGADQHQRLALVRRQHVERPAEVLHVEMALLPGMHGELAALVPSRSSTSRRRRRHSEK